MAEAIPIKYPSPYGGSRPFFVPDIIRNQGTPYLSAGNQPMTQFGDAMRGYSLYQLPSNYVSATAAQPTQPSTQAVPMYLNRNAPPYDQMGVFDRYRNMASGLAPAAAAAAAQSVTQPVEQQVPEATVPQAAQVEAPQSVMSAESLPRTAMPALRPQQNSTRYIESKGIDALDAGAAADDFGRRYAAVAATGAIPVVSEAVLAELNRQRARDQAALSAATKARDVNDMYAAMGDPNLRARAQALSQANGISFDLAMKQALQSMLLERGEHNLANRYEMQNVLPAVNAEQERRTTLANELGGNVGTMNDVYGASYRTNGIDALYSNPDGSRTALLPWARVNATPNAVATLAVLANPSYTSNAAYNLRQANAQTGINAQLAVANQVNAARQQVAKNEKTALDYFNDQQKLYYQGMNANARLQNADTNAFKASNSADSQEFRNLLAAYKALPDGDPRKQELAVSLNAILTGSPTTPNGY